MQKGICVKRHSIRKRYILFLLSIGMFVYLCFFSTESFWQEKRVWISKEYAKPLHVTVDDDGVVYDVMTHAKTVDDMMREQHIPLKNDDIVFGVHNNQVYNRSHLIVRRARHIELTIGKEVMSIVTHQTSLETMLSESHIEMNDDDIFLPKGTRFALDGAKISLVRVVIEEKNVDTSIAYTKTVEEDASMSFRKSTLVQKGENGIKRTVWRILSHNGKEVDRKIVTQTIVQEPISEKMIQGTKVSVGKAHTGLGTWYAYTGTLAAASPWLPMGSYAKVTNQENGKSVIVKINDRGPFGKNRIIDLDKVAFVKIASIGAGIINVKVEEVTN